MSRHRDWDIACKVYIGNLGNNASKYELEDAFSKYGPLKNVWVARNPPGFAFVEFEDPRDAEDSVRGLDGTRVCGVGLLLVHHFVFPIHSDILKTEVLVQGNLLSKYISNLPGNKYEFPYKPITLLYPYKI